MRHSTTRALWATVYYITIIVLLWAFVACAPLPTTLAECAGDEKCERGVLSREQRAAKRKEKEAQALVCIRSGGVLIVDEWRGQQVCAQRR